MEFIFTRHSKIKMGQLGYTAEDVKEAIIKGMKFGPDSRGNAHSRLGVLEVVFRRENNSVVIITVFEMIR